MGLMGTLAKVAIGYAAARGVDKMTDGGGLGALLGGKAQVPAQDPMAKTQAQAVAGMTGEANPMAEMLQKMTQGGGDLSAMMGGAPGANPLAGMMDKMKEAGFDLSAMTGGGADKTGGLLSQLSGAGGTGLAGMMATATGAAAMTGKGVGGMIDQFNTGQTAPELEASAGLMLRAMIMAAKADGGIDAAEKAKLLDTVGDDADAEDMAFVQAQLAAPVDPEALAADVPEAQKAQVYSASLMTIRVDTDAEAQYLDRLAKALGLDEPVVNMLHMQMGMKPLYA
ncbi:DUF533 domain-containing protein [Mesobacterium sp. TK19101]|uniref:DUF533 domain-containing protein n=1 Tax=Mesobacterium hydrothermale TaxID=3111907 RepID=A0ABU6HI08_9RHOB|nr:DUF533 domain-containing protein [Mesobacterium sp. TK19101]MEC3861083.1 DUF533 domain-containing protein [Mesobacterium sp. TK19101]